MLCRRDVQDAEAASATIQIARNNSVTPRGGDATASALTPTLSTPLVASVAQSIFPVASAPFASTSVQTSTSAAVTGVSDSSGGCGYLTSSGRTCVNLSPPTPTVEVTQEEFVLYDVPMQVRAAWGLECESEKRRREAGMEWSRCCLQSANERAVRCWMCCSADAPTARSDLIVFAAVAAAVAACSGRRRPPSARCKAARSPPLTTTRRWLWCRVWSAAGRRGASTRRLCPCGSAPAMRVRCPLAHLP